MAVSLVKAYVPRHRHERCATWVGGTYDCHATHDCDATVIVQHGHVIPPSGEGVFVGSVPGRGAHRKVSAPVTDREAIAAAMLDVAA